MTYNVIDRPGKLLNELNSRPPNFKNYGFVKGNVFTTTKGLFESYRLKNSLAFKREISYNKFELSCKEPFKLMPARTLNDFFAGFFYAGIRARQEAGMVITYKGQGTGDVKKIKVEGDKEKEVIVRHDNVPPKWKGKQKWNWD